MRYTKCWPFGSSSKRHDSVTWKSSGLCLSFMRAPYHAPAAGARERPPRWRIGGLAPLLPGCMDPVQLRHTTAEVRMGIAELLAVLFIVLLFFGASRLPRSERASARRSEASRSAMNGEGVGGGGAKARLASCRRATTPSGTAASSPPSVGRRGRSTGSGTRRRSTA